MSTTDDEPTIGKLIADISRDVSLLVQNEIALAKSELKVSVRASGWGIAFFAVAAFILLLVVILASITFAYMLTLTGLHPAWAFGIVTLVYIAIAVILCVLGYYRFKKVKMPERTIESAMSLPDLVNPANYRDHAPSSGSLASSTPPANRPPFNQPPAA
jgi:hypothetical protein